MPTRNVRQGPTCRSDLLTAGLADRDGDELPDTVDVCPDVADPAQTDTDHDGIGDACDRRTAGNGIREPGEDCDGADDTACPGECQPDATCQCSTELPRGVRVRLGHQRPLVTCRCAPSCHSASMTVGVSPFASTTPVVVRSRPAASPDTCRVRWPDVAGGGGMETDFARW